MAIQDAYESQLAFYDCYVFERIKGIYTLIYDREGFNYLLDTVERQTKAQAVQEFCRRLKNGMYNNIFVP